MHNDDADANDNDDAADDCQTNIYLNMNTRTHTCRLK